MLSGRLRQFHVAPRDALAAPTTSHQDHVLSIVILVISVISALGAGWILLSFAFFPRLRSFRHQLILGLAISDFVMAVNFCSSAAMNLAGNNIGADAHRGFCRYNGFMTQTFVIQTDYWVLAIGICTYLILADHKNAACWVQDHVALVSCLPWFFSVLWAIVGLVTADYGNIGAWCWFTSDEIRLLVNFIPRWVIIVIVLVMYARLYAVLFRAHRFMSSSERAATDLANRQRDAAHAGSSGNYGRGAPALSTKRLKRLARLMIMYPVAYMIIWALPTAIRIYQACTGKAAPFVLQTIDKACIVVQGIVDAFIYGFNESSLSAWRERFFPASHEAQETISMYRLSARRTQTTTHTGRESMDDTSSTARIATDGTDDEGENTGLGFGASAKEYTIQKTVEVSVSYGGRVEKTD